MLALTDAMNLCLISDAEPVRAAVRASCLPPHEVEIFGLEGFLNPDNTLSEYGASVVQAAKKADAILIDWSLERAPLVNTIASAVRSKKTFAPVIALCGGGQEEMIAALASGVDDVTSFPLNILLFQARVVAHRRLVEAVRRASAKRVKKKIKQKKEKALELVEAKVEKVADTLVEGLEEQVEELVEHIEEEARGDGLTPEGGQVVEVVGTEVEKFAEGLIENVAEELIEHVTDGLAENVAEKLVEAVDTELVLVDPAHDIVQVGALRLNRTAYRVHIGDDEVELTPKEFELLSFFMEHTGELCTRDQILDRVWGIDFETGTNMVDVYMHFLRKKLAAHGLSGTIQTVRGRGYRLVVPDVEPA